MRQRMEEHRSNPACASCHKMMDPIGFALENFDGIGKWRTKEAGQKLDASGQLVDGSKDRRRREPPAGPCTLLSAVRARRDGEAAHVRAGRGVDYDDMPTVRSIVREAGKSNNQVFGDCARNRQERTISNESEARHREREGRAAAVGKIGSRQPRWTCKEADQMFITKKHISRRTFLRGAGVTLALPFLESMVPAFTSFGQRTGGCEGSSLCGHLQPAWLGAEPLGDE